MGRPIEIGEMGESTTPARLPCRGPPLKLTDEAIFVSVDQIVVSVGPYMFHNSPQRGSSSLANSRDNASPPHSTLSLRSPFQPASMSIRQVAGVACMMVAPQAAIRSFKSNPSEAVSRLRSEE